MADPSGTWIPGTAEQYIDQQIATITGNLANETIARQTTDQSLQTQINAEVTTRYNTDQQHSTQISQLQTTTSNLQTQLNSEMTTRADQDSNLNALINAGIREGGGVEFDIVPVQNSANGITSGGMYSTLRDSNIGFVDDVPIAESDNLVKSGGIFPTINSVNKTILPINGKISIIGDSISAYSGTIPSGYSPFYPSTELNVTSVYDMWWQLILSLSNATLEVNASWRGSNVTSATGVSDFYERTSILGNPNYIFVELGTNDSHLSKPLGDYNFESPITDLSETEFIPAYIKGVKSLISNYPSANIVLLAFQMKETYYKAIKTIGEHYNIPVIDVRSYYVDNIHPDNKGMMDVAQTITKYYLRDRVDEEPVINSKNPVSSSSVYDIQTLTIGLEPVSSIFTLKYIVYYKDSKYYWQYKADADSEYIPVKKGEKLIFTRNNVTNYYVPNAVTCVYAVLTEVNKNPGNGTEITSVIDAMTYTDWQDAGGSDTFEYLAEQDCYVFVCKASTDVITSCTISRNSALKRIEDAEVDIEGLKETFPVWQLPKMNGRLGDNGTNLGSSNDKLFRVSLDGISKVVLHTAVNSVSKAWATYDAQGDAGVKRVGPDASVLYTTRPSIDDSLLMTYVIDVEPGEEWLYFVVGFATIGGKSILNDFFTIHYYTDDAVQTQIKQYDYDKKFPTFAADDENIYYMLARLMNSVKMRQDMTTPIWAYENYGNPSDCTMVYDSNNFYIVGVKPNATGQSTNNGNDIATSSDCGIKLITVSRSTGAESEQLILVMGQNVTCTDGNTYTIQRGGSMPNIAILNGKLYIIFSTMINDTFCEMRCIYNPSTANVESYSLCKFTDAPMTLDGLLSKGYKLESFSGEYIGKTMNINAFYGNAKASNGTYYVGMCLCGSYRYPFVLTTTDFETFDIWKQIEQPHSRAMFELSTCLSSDGNLLYTALRNDAHYIIVSTIDVATKEIIDTQYVAAAGSRPCLYLGHDNHVYMYYTLEEARQSGRVMKVDGVRDQRYIADIAQLVQYAEIQKADDNVNYYIFVLNKIYKVKPETYTLLNAYNLANKIVELLE